MCKIKTLGIVTFVLLLTLAPQITTAQNFNLLGDVKISDVSGSFTATLDNADLFGYSSASLGDLDGDGIEDVAIGSLYDDDGGTDRGAVHILFLNSNGSVKSYTKIANNTGGFTGTLDNSDLFGSSIANIGDIDGDGVTDIAVGAQYDDDGATNKGAVWILFLNTNGTVKNFQKISDTQGGFTGTMISAGWFGASVVGLGDLNNDGINDIAVGAVGEVNGATRKGAVWVLFLNTNGTVKSHQLIHSSSGNFTGQLDYADRFGASLANIGDINNDGITDIAVGAYYDDDGGTDRGAVWILFLDTNGTVKGHQKISDTQGGFTGTMDNIDIFGMTVTSLGDFDGDGISDILVGAPLDDDGGTDRGALWLLYLNTDGTVKLTDKISDTLTAFSGNLSNGDRFGQSVTKLTNLNASGELKILTGAAWDDDGGTDRGAAYVLTLRAPLTTPEEALVHNSAQDQLYNWSYSENYDENDSIIQASKQYLDELGRSTQVLSKNFVTNKVMAAQTVYDQYGRPVLSTLPAPIGTNMGYKAGFISNVFGNDYKWTNMEGNKLNNPDLVGNVAANTLGHYYSNSGPEDYVATSSYPYSRIEYMADNTGRVKRASALGEHLKMGSGRENRMFYMFTAGELDRAYGVDSSFYSNITLQNPIHSTALSNTEIVAEKTISIDAEGTISITFVSDGLTIASCVSGMTPTPSVPEQSAKNTLLYAGTRSVDIHLPLTKSTTLKLPLPTYRVPDGVLDDGIVDSNEINFTLMDLETNQLLVENTNYTINGSTRFVTFSGTNKHRFLRIAYNYTSTKLNFFVSNDITPPDATAEYKLDYSHFSVNYYDLAGRLRANVSPKGFDYSVNGKHTEFSRYDYSPLGQVIIKQMPDEGLTQFLYSDEGLLRFSQNALQQTEDKFAYVRYDVENRMIEKGEYIENGASTYEFAGFYDAASTGTDVKTIVDSVSKLFTTQTHHEHYVAYDLLASADEIPSAYSYKSNFASTNLEGKVSKTWNEHHQTWYSYDYAGRMTFTVQELLDTIFNTNVDETIKTVNYTYAPVTSVLLKEEYQKYHSTEKTTNLYTYNANMEPITVVVQDAANQTIAQADFEYYLSGQLKRKVLGNNLQGIDYVYTLNGQLKSMNHPTLELQYDPGNDGGENGFPEDLFGFALDYHENDYVRNNSNVSAVVQDGYYNGLIKATRWKIKDENEIYQSSGNIELYNNEDLGMELMYQYTYDKFYRLETANFGVFNGSDFTVEEHYQVYGGGDSGAIEYDIIGNIKTLKRNGFSGDYGLLMDDLEYTYASGTSKLTEVTDNSTSTYTTDFKTDNGNNFLYNETGQMTAATPDEVDSILYYPGGLVKQLIHSNGDTISYVYNEQGKKIKTIFVDVQNNPNITTSTWYATDATGKVHGVYEKVDTAAVSLTAEVLYAGGRLAVVSNNLVNYELTDHLGNVRVTFADTSSTDTPELMVTSWTDYYPFGEVLPGRSSNPDGQLFGYQGQQKAGNNSKWYAFQLRMYNPSLGRWNGTDPYYQHDSPYLAMANNPVSFVDPDGGRAVMTEYMKKKILNHLFDTKSNITRIEWLRIWMGATGMNHYRGITFEGFYAAIATGTARGINAAVTLNREALNTSEGSSLIGGDISAAIDSYLGPLGGGFLDAPFSSNVSVEEFSLALAYEAKGASDLAELNGWSEVLTRETDAMIANYNEISNNINSYIADKEVMDMVVAGMISNDAITLPTFYHIEGQDNDARYKKHVSYFSDGLDIDHYNLMNNPIVQAAHNATSSSAQFIGELVEAVSFATGVGGLVRGGISLSVKLLASQTARLAAKGVGQGTNVVYQGFNKAGVVEYVGITGRDAAVRFGEHLSSGTAKSLLRYEVIPGATNLSRTGARVWEQTLINQHGLNNLLNVRNSIAPKYWFQYGVKP